MAQQSKEKRRARYIKNREDILRKAAEKRKCPIAKEKAKEYAANYRKVNKESIAVKDRIRKKEVYVKNKESILHKNSEWRRNNKDKFNAYGAKHRAAKKKANFIGNDLEWYEFFMDEIYSLSRLRSKLTNIVHHVDHIIPLQHPKVCGLHTPSNLQIITASENFSKNNYFSGE